MSVVFSATSNLPSQLRKESYVTRSLPSEDQAKEPTLLCSGGGAAINLDVLAVPLHYYWMLRRTFLENYNVMS